MSSSRAELESSIASLAARLPALRAEYPDNGDLMMAFAGEADVVQDAAGPADEAWVHERLSALLSEAIGEA
ncbi:hypothetical protein R2APBS1_2089 [Rhodanobacter denitrificans]|uniref:Uncharacterized protein n=1 Tax=Rhodanobacter denitrificans TaxID=666685 RepID=M4NEG6_9GAMM|nr:hypothetical protein [Rhodanobacter denitrificans]AGG89210.1 hypothetical protein R2APBS1_2089 [Rhodanobacter denitrificans]UJJ60533.1 hypothetical protein LRK55_19050 [Rhodanobacter denitrificans]